MGMMKAHQAKFDLNGLVDVINKTNRRFANNEMRSFRRTSENWETKPNYKSEEIDVGFGIKEFKIYTIDKRWFWINYGTDKHEIKPKGQGYPLKFQKGYDPKTVPNKIQSVGSGNRYGDVVKTYSVEQKIEPRNWLEEIKKKAPERWSRALQTELKTHVNKKVG